MTRRFSFAPKEYYHIYNRGTEKRNIFVARGDYERFLTLLHLCNGTVIVNVRKQGPHLSNAKNIERGEPLVDICFYCLMPNHFHLFLQERTENGISKFIQKVSTGYTRYFNEKRKRTGALFGGKFKATHINDDRYAKYLISYIHLNPIKLIEPTWKESGIKDIERSEKFLAEYPYSSFKDYAGTDRIENILINMEAAPRYFDSPGDFRQCTREWLNYRL